MCRVVFSSHGFLREMFEDHGFHCPLSGYLYICHCFDCFHDGVEGWALQMQSLEGKMKQAVMPTDHA